MGAAGVAESAFSYVDEVEGLSGPAAVEWLSRVPLPRFVIDAELRLLWSNAAAKSAIANSRTMSIRDGRLCFQDPSYADRLRLAHNQSGTKEIRQIVSDRNGNADLVLSAFAPRSEDGRAICVSIMLVSRTLDLELCGFIDHFALTRSEGRIAQSLVNLETPKAISRDLGVSISTVRTHIRSIYLKAAIRSQSELMRLAASYCMV